MAMSPELKGLFRSFLNFAVLIVGLLSGIGQLASFSEGLGRLVLQVIAVTCLLFIVIRVWFVYFLARIKQLKGEVERVNALLTGQREGHMRYLEAIERISDRENPLFEETLEVEVSIGNDDDSDVILEKRRTLPHSRVTHRTMRPIVPDEERVARLDEISFRAEVRESAGSITYLPLRERIRFLRVWLVFDPALTGPTTWEVEYHPKGLWRPLRQRGYDVLKWDDRLPTANGSPSALTDFVVRFLFPKSEQEPSVSERNGFGVLEKPARTNGSGWQVVWRDAKPAGRHYAWDLTQSTGGPPAS